MDKFRLSSDIHRAEISIAVVLSILIPNTIQDLKKLGLFEKQQSVSDPRCLEGSVSLSIGGVINYGASGAVFMGNYGSAIFNHDNWPFLRPAIVASIFE